MLNFKSRLSDVMTRIKQRSARLRDMQDLAGPKGSSSAGVEINLEDLVMQVVPTPDSTANTYEHEVIGNKADAAVQAVGTNKSLMGYMKGAITFLLSLVGLHAVPTANAVTNANVRDVVGNKTDAAATAVAADKSLMSYAKWLCSLPAQFGTLLNTGGTATLAAIIGDVANSSLVARLTAIYDGLVAQNTAPGTRFTIFLTLTSSDIITTGVDLTGLITGKLIFRDIHWDTDDPGIVGEGVTGFTIKTTNTKGEGTLLDETALNLMISEASFATADWTSPSSDQTSRVLEEGSKLTLHSVGANCTGVGTVDIAITFERGTQGATVAAPAP